MGTVPTTPIPTSTLPPIGTQQPIAKQSPTQTNPYAAVPTNTEATAINSAGFTQTYGDYLGSDLSSALQGLGTNTAQAVQATNAAAEIQGQHGFDSLRGQETAGGISPNSSTSALEGSDYWNQFDTNLENTDAQLELAGSNELVNAIETAGAAHGPDESGFSEFSSIASPVISGIADIYSGGAAATVPGGVGGVATSFMQEV
jgi:hypothetical protein